MTDQGYAGIRTKLDGNDGFATGHQVLKTTGATRHAARMKRVPVWALNDAKIRELIQKRFPKMGTDLEQRNLAGRMVRIIHLYFRVGLTAASVAEELKMTVKATKRVIERITKQMSGELKPSHRPQKGGAIETPYRVEGETSHISL